MKKASVAVIIPTYNEARNCAELIPLVAEILPQAQILVVDDSSPDGTATVIKKLQKKYPQLQLVLGKKKQGRGAAVRQGFQYALQHTKAAVLVEMDADFSHRPVELPQLVAAVTPHTVALACRYAPGSSIENWPLWRTALSAAANKLIATIAGLRLRDNTNGYRAYPRAAISLILDHELTSKSYLALTETAVVLQHHNFSFHECQSIFPNRVHGVSNTTLKEVYSNLVELLRLHKTYASGCTCHAHEQS